MMAPGPNEHGPSVVQGAQAVGPFFGEPTQLFLVALAFFP